jgi:hypothetical protein
VDGDETVGPSQRFRVEEVAQGEFEEVHPVDEDQVDREISEEFAGASPGEELIAGSLLDMTLGQLTREDGRVRIDPHAYRVLVSEPHGVTVKDPDLEIGAGPPGVVEVRKNVEVVKHSGPLSLEYYLGGQHTRRTPSAQRARFLVGVFGRSRTGYLPLESLPDPTTPI